MFWTRRTDCVEHQLLRASAFYSLLDTAPVSSGFTRSCESLWRDVSDVFEISAIVASIPASFAFHDGKEDFVYIGTVVVIFARKTFHDSLVRVQLRDILPGSYETLLSFFSSLCTKQTIVFFFFLLFLRTPTFFVRPVVQLLFPVFGHSVILSYFDCCTHFFVLPNTLELLQFLPSASGWNQESTSKVDERASSSRITLVDRLNLT